MIWPNKKNYAKMDSLKYKDYKNTLFLNNKSVKIAKTIKSKQLLPSIHLKLILDINYWPFWKNYNDFGFFEIIQKFSLNR